MENELAFPFQSSNDDRMNFAHSGLTKRELFAAMAMQGILACPNGSKHEKNVALTAQLHADALLQQLTQHYPQESAQQAWQSALTIANNICVENSNRFNNDDQIEEAAACDKCAKEIRAIINQREPLTQSTTQKQIDQ